MLPLHFFCHLNCKLTPSTQGLCSYILSVCLYECVCSSEALQIQAFVFKCGQGGGESGALFQRGWRTVYQVTFDPYPQGFDGFSPWKVSCSRWAGSAVRCLAAKKAQSDGVTKGFKVLLIQCTIYCKQRQAGVMSRAPRPRCSSGYATRTACITFLRQGIKW